MAKHLDNAADAGEAIEEPHKGSLDRHDPQHLLNIPRELRDQIYGYCGVTRQRRCGSLWMYNLTMVNTPDVQLVLACRQNRDEYCEASMSKPALEIKMMYQVRPDEIRLCLESFVPEFLSKRIKRCVVVANARAYLNAVTAGFPSRADCNAFLDLRREKKVDQESMTWTPSKYFKRELVDHINMLKNLLCDDAVVIFQFHFHFEGFFNTSELKWAVDSGILHLPTLRALESTATWPAQGNLKLQFYCTTPLFMWNASRKLKNGRLVGVQVPRGASYCRGVRVVRDGQLSVDDEDLRAFPQEMSSVELTVWRLHAPEEAKSMPDLADGGLFCGFWPEFIAAVDESEAVDAEEEDH